MFKQTESNGTFMKLKFMMHLNINKLCQSNIKGIIMQAQRN